MARSCPSGPQWDKAVDEFGTFNTFKYYHEHGEQLHDMETMREYLRREQRIKSPPNRLSDTEVSLVNGFLKDFGITTEKYKSLKDDLGIDGYTAADLIAKAIAYQEGESILPEVAYFAYSMLGKQNSKMRSTLRYLIQKWEKYDERWRFHRDAVSLMEGYIYDKREWKSIIRDRVIVDFLTEKLKEYSEDPKDFKKIADVRWTSEDFTSWQIFIRDLKRMLEAFGAFFKKNRTDLDNLAYQIADEILTQNYELFDYQLSEDQIRKYYKNTLESDKFAKGIIEFGQKMGLILTGSLALRRAGTVYRSTEESLHDIDWVIAHEMVATGSNAKITAELLAELRSTPGIKLADKLGFETANKITWKHLIKYDWFKKFTEQYPSYRMVNLFYGREHTNFESATVQGVINGEFWEKEGYHYEEKEIYKKNKKTGKAEKVTIKERKWHWKGDWKKDTGYVIDFFVRLEDYQEEHDNYFKLWKEIMVAKLIMGRDKDFKDWKAFTPYMKSKDTYNFKWRGFRHVNYSSSQQNNMLEDTKDNPGFVSNMGMESMSDEFVSYAVTESDKDQARNIIISVTGSLYNKKGELSQWQIDSINSKMARLYRGGDVPWVYKLSSKGNYYLAGYKNGSVLHDDYYTEYGNNVWMVDDTEANMDRAGTPRQFSGNPKKFIPRFDQIDKDQSNHIVHRLANQLRDQTEVDFQIITEEEAIEITKHAANPYAPGKGQRAFFFEGKVYFVGDHLTTTMVLHEYAHPIIRSIAYQNPQLFEKLYNKVAETAEGQAIIARIKSLPGYEGMTEVPRMFMEEVIVQAMTKRAEDIMRDQESSSGFMAAMKEILYQIKKLLRGIFGKVSVSKLNVDTSLKDLAEMLIKGESFVLDRAVITPNDIAAYMAESAEFIDEIAGSLHRVQSQELRTSATKGYHLAIQHIEEVRASENFRGLSDVLINEFDRGYLRELKDRFGKYTEKHDAELTALKGEIEIHRLRAQSLAEGIVRLDSMMDRFVKHMKEMMDESIDDQNNLQRTVYYMKFMKSWVEYADFLIEQSEIYGVDEESPLVTVLRRIKGRYEKAEKIAQDIYRFGVKDFLYDTLEPMMERVKEKYEKRIAWRERKGHKKSLIDNEYKELYGMTKEEWLEYNKLKKVPDRQGDDARKYDYLDKKFLNNGMFVTRRKLDKMLTGKLEDANWANTFFEGYMYNSDPVVGGFATYLRNHLTDVLNSSYLRYNEFLKDVTPALEAIGFSSRFSPRTFGLAQKVLFADVIGKYDPEQNKVTPYKVMTFLSAHKGYRLELSLLHRDLQEAQMKWAETGNNEDKLAILKVEAKIDQFKRDYMHQEYVQEFYEKDKFLVRGEDDTIGLLAKEKRDELIESIKELTSEILNEDDEMMREEDLDKVWAEYREWHTRYTPEGKLKPSGEENEYELEIIDRLIAYRNETQEFFESVPIKGLFETTFNDRENQWAAEGKTGDQLEAARNAWLAKNTVEVLTEEFWKEKREILRKLAEIDNQISGKMTPEEFNEYKKLRNRERAGRLDDADKPRYEELKAEHAKSISESELWEEILDICYRNRDNDGQVNGREIHPDAMAKIKDLSLKIEQKRKEDFKKSKLSKEEWNELHELDEMFMTEEAMTNEEKARYRELLEKKKAGNISYSLKRKRMALLRRLKELQSSIASIYYCDEFNNWIEIADFDVSPIAGRNEITPDSADFFLKVNVADKMRAAHPGFKEWFDRNHILVQKYNKRTKREEPVYQRLYPWRKVEPNNPHHYETTTITLADGTKRTIRGKPTRKFEIRVVKDKYRTKRIVGETVTNKGFNDFLPRLPGQKNPIENPKDNKFVNETYFHLKKAYETDPNSEDGKVFHALEKLKEWHLANQEGLDYKSKLYLELPRYRRNALEMLRARGTRENIEGLSQEDKDQHFVVGKINEKMPFVGQVIESVRNAFWKSSDDADSEYNWKKDQYMLITTDLFDNVESSIFIGGKFDIHADHVSVDVIQSMMKYMMSATRYKKLNSINPMAQALQSVLLHHGQREDTYKGMEMLAKGAYLNQGITNYLTKKGRSIREMGITNQIERDFEGIVNKSFGRGRYAMGNSKALNTIVKLLFRRAAMGFFSINFQSAMKNWIGPKWQGMLETVSGEFMTPLSLSLGQKDAHLAAWEMSLQLYSAKPKGLLTQIVDSFDAVAGRTEEEIGKSPQRTIFHDIVNMSWMYNFRKWTEIEATLTLFFGILNKHKVKRNGRHINYRKAFELRDGIIRLKEGIDVRYHIVPTEHNIQLKETYEEVADRYNIEYLTPQEEREFRTLDKIDELDRTEEEQDRFKILKEKNQFNKIISRDQFEAAQAAIIVQEEKRREALEEVANKEDNEEKIERINEKFDKEINRISSLKIDNTEFKRIKNRAHIAINDLQGAYSKLDQPEAQRYLAFRFITFLRRYFTTMATKRFGHSGTFWDPKPRFNPGTGNTSLGYWMDVYRSMRRTLLQDKFYMLRMTNDEYRSWIRAAAEVGFIYFLSAFVLPWLGYDPDEPSDERYEKMRQRSGPLSRIGPIKIPGVVEDPDRPFHLGGWIQNMAILQVMYVRAENEALVPWPGMGLTDYVELFKTTTTAFGPTVESYVKLTGQMTQPPMIDILDENKNVIGEDFNSDYYYKKTVGPYTWQRGFSAMDQEQFDAGEMPGVKWHATFMKMFGFDGTNIDPYWKVRALERQRKTKGKMR